MIYQCGRCGLTRASGQEMGVIQQCKCPFEFNPPVMPQQRTWVGLEDWEIKKLVGSDKYSDLLTAVAIAVEKTLKERNT